MGKGAATVFILQPPTTVVAETPVVGRVNAVVGVFTTAVAAVILGSTSMAMVAIGVAARVIAALDVSKDNNNIVKKR